MKRTIWGAAFVLLIFAVFAFQKILKTKGQDPIVPIGSAQRPIENDLKEGSKPDEFLGPLAQNTTPGEAKDEPEPSISRSVLSLDRSNFEEFVLTCFQGEPCELKEDPISLYHFFKSKEMNHANDLLISFLRKNMSDRRWRDQFKEPLRKMIDDFYSPHEKPFQMAAFYNYAGDLEKSLELYLDLEKKAQVDLSLRPAPKLNIANTLYDLRRYQQALPYYQAALSEYLAAPNEVQVPSSQETARFIERRIREIKSRVSQ